MAKIANDFDRLNEWLYWITVMGTPSADQPQGWQLDGHHAIINYFVLGDQVVMTPLFVGSEPAVAVSGKYKGVAVLQREQAKGLEFDHQRPVFPPLTAGRPPIRQHLHAVVRMPNGNDYGKDLLRRHYERSHRAD